MLDEDRDTAPSARVAPATTDRETLRAWATFLHGKGLPLVRTRSDGCGHVRIPDDTDDARSKRNPPLTLSDLFGHIDAGGNVELLLDPAGLLQIDAERLDLPEPWRLDAFAFTITQHTPGGGFHAIVKRPEGVKAHRWVRPFPGLELDLLSRGAWPLPGSARTDKVPGRWGAIGEPRKPGDAPAWLAEKLRELSKPRSAPAPVASDWKPEASGEREVAYVVGAIAGKLADVESTTDGARNATLNKKAFEAAQSAAYVGLDTEQLVEPFVEAGMVAGLPEREARSAAKNGVRDGAQQPRKPEPKERSTSTRTKNAPGKRAALTTPSEPGIAMPRAESPVVERDEELQPFTRTTSTQAPASRDETGPSEGSANGLRDAERVPSVIERAATPTKTLPPPTPAPPAPSEDELAAQRARGAASRAALGLPPKPPAPTPAGALLPFRRVFDLERLRPQDDIVRGLLGPRELVLFWGEPSGGKTLAAVALCGSIATGEPFLGLEIQHTGSVVYVAGEGLAGLRNRFDALAHGLDAAAQRAIAERVYVVTAAPNLLDPSAAAQLVATVAEIHKNAGPVRLVVLDTLASMTPGSDENSQDSGTSVIALGRSIAERADGASVLAVHHAKKDGSEYRGSSTLGGGFDVIMKAKKTGSGFELHVRKQKDRECPPDGWAFTAESVVIQEGDAETEIRSVRVGSVTRSDGQIDRDVGLETTLGRVADALAAAGHPGADALRRNLDLGIVLLLDAGPKRFGEVVAACKWLGGVQDSPKGIRSKVGRALKRMTKDGHLIESGAERGRTYSLAEPGRKAFSGALDALKNLPAEECPW